MEGRYDAVRARIKQIPQDVEANRKKIEKAEADMTSVEARVETMREKRQGMLARGEDAAKISGEIKKVREEKELLEDQVIGLQNLVLNLAEEEKGLREEIKKLAEELGRQKVSILIGPYNETAAKLALISEEILLTAMQYGQPVSEYTNSLFNISSFNAFMSIPRLSRTGEEKPAEDAFNLRYFGQRVSAAYQKANEAREQKKETPLDIVDFVRAFRAERTAKKDAEK